MISSVKRHIILIFLFAYTLASWTQPIQKGGVPLGLAYPEIQSSIKSILLSGSHFVNSTAELNSSTEGKNGIPECFGVSIPLSQNLTHDSPCLINRNYKVWQYRVISEGAQALALIFNRFEIPEKGRLFIYSPDFKTILGHFDYTSSSQSKPFVTQFITGDQVVIEYSEIIDPLDSSKSEPGICLSEVVHAFKSLDEISKDEGDSGGCHVNINCPEGNSWQKQKRGVAKLLLKKGSLWYNCSGSLVNNTLNNGEPYFLTADHCGGDATDDDRSLWQFYFNYERPDCTNSNEPVNSSYLVGCSLVARAPMDGGSDFQLLKLNQELPLQALPYFNGWDRSLTASKSGVGVHHPSGDVKKISTYTRTLTTTTPNIGGNLMAVYSAWRAYWTQTETNFGVTEGGSSGSPLFESNGNIVGTLSGGNSSCSNPIGADFYGKFSFHWSSNGSDSIQKLQPWLDPIDSNISTLNGFDPLVPRNLSLHVDSKVVTLEWDYPLISTDLIGFYVYGDGELLALLNSELNSYSIDYNSKRDVAFFVTALFSTPEYQSEPSNIVIASIETSSSFIANGENFCKVFPNPSTNNITVESLKPIKIIRIFSSSGFVVFENTNPDQHFEVIDVSAFLPGLYLFDLVSFEGNRFSQRLIVN